MRTVFSLCLATLLLDLGFAQQTAPDPILVPAYPAPTNLANSASFKGALQSISAAIDAARTTPTVYGTLDNDTTSFSVDIYSVHETESLLTYHFSAPGLSPASIGVNTVNSDTIYRIGSVSKLLTVYTFLVAVGDASWNDPVTKYIPELAAYATQNTTKARNQPFNYWDFNSITVGAIASQLGGITRGFAVEGQLDELLTEAGFPPVPPINDNATDCGKLGFTGVPCTRKDAIANLINAQPVFPAFYTPAYSNTAFTLLMYVLENITSGNMPDLLQHYLAQPLGLTSTTYNGPPDTSNALIPYNESVSWWGYDLKDVTPAGGYYSSTNDMRKIGVAILNSTLLSQSQTRRWMKPDTFTYDPDMAVGAPWEIFRAPLNRTSWMYTKSGDINTYGTLVVYLPDWDVGITIFAAGLNFELQPLILGNIITQYLLPALEEAAKEQAVANLVGTYVEPTTGSIITLTADEYPGLNITKWTIEGNESAYAPLQNVGFLPPHETGRIYPAGFVSADGTQMAWRAVYEDLPDTTCSPGIFNRLVCATWTSIDFYTYGGAAVDNFLITTDASGRAVTVSPRDIQYNYKRQ